MARITLFLLSFVMWLTLVWPFSLAGGELTIDFQSIIAGIIASVATAAIFYDFTENHHKIYHLNRYLWFLVFIPVFIYECIKANFYVAYLVLHPDMPIHPGIVKVKTKLKSNSGRTILANCITLTPGTLTVDITDDGHLYIHWIDVTSKDVDHATETIVNRFENYLTKIFD